MELYERIVSPKGKVTYREHKPTDIMPDMEIEADEVISIISTMIVSFITMMKNQLPPSDILHRKIKNVNRELTELAAVGFVNPGSRGLYVDVGVQAWNAAVKAVQTELLAR